MEMCPSAAKAGHVHNIDVRAEARCGEAARTLQKLSPYLQKPEFFLSLLSGAMESLAGFQKLL
jgi:hypothetical protein